MGRDTVVGRTVRGAGQVALSPVNFARDIGSGKNVFDSLGVFGANTLSGGLNYTGLTGIAKTLDKPLGKVPIVGSFTGAGKNAIAIQDHGVNKARGFALGRDTAIAGATIVSAGLAFGPGSASAVGASGTGAAQGAVAAAGGGSFLGTVGTVATGAAVTGLVTGIINKGQKAVGDFVSNLTNPQPGQSISSPVEYARASTPYGGYESIPYKGPAATQPRGSSMMPMLLIGAALVGGFILVKRKMV